MTDGNMAELGSGLSSGRLGLSNIAGNLVLGAHMSIAGGIYNAVLEGERTGCKCIQVFTKSSNQWKARTIPQSEIDQFKQLLKTTGIAPVVAHDSYLINIASPNSDLKDRSVNALLEELERVEMLGIPYLVMHPGAHVESSVEDGLRRVSEGLNFIHSKTKNYKSMICLEITAGQGTTLGRSFEELKTIINNLLDPERVGICLDTCHLFAAGYDLKSRDGFVQTFDLFDKIIGFEKLKVVHLNDSKKGLKCHVDRHEHIGKGTLGVEPFKWLLNDPRFQNIPLILETPKGVSNKEDLENLAILRSLINKN